MHTDTNYHEFICLISDDDKGCAKTANSIRYEINIKSKSKHFYQTENLDLRQNFMKIISFPESVNVFFSS